MWSGLYLNSHSIGKYILSTYPKRRLKFIQPIILFLVQSFGKYQIPRDLTMILLQGIKMSTWAVERTWTQLCPGQLAWVLGGKGQAKLYHHFITSTSLLGMHLFPAVIVLSPLQQFKTGIKSELENTELRRSQKLKLFSESVLNIHTFGQRVKLRQAGSDWEREKAEVQLLTGCFHLLRNRNFVNSVNKASGGLSSVEKFTSCVMN